MSQTVKVYVDENCIGCQACTNEAPSMFEMNPETNHSVFIGAPDKKSDTCELSPEDVELCEKVIHCGNKFHSTTFFFCLGCLDLPRFGDPC